MSARKTAAVLVALALCVLSSAGCSDDDQRLDGALADGRSDVGDAGLEASGDGAAGDGTVGDGPGGDGISGDGVGADAGDDAGDGPVESDGSAADGFQYPDGFNPGNTVACQGTIYECGNGEDDDQDGLPDALDPDCIGPCDDDESSFETGIPGDNQAHCKQDCYFDGNSGSGTDKCEWTHKCDPLSPGQYLSPPCLYDQDYVDDGKCPSVQKPSCLDSCLPLTPNGCDCFGCCEVHTKAGVLVIYLGTGPDCSWATPQNCAACTQVSDCLNDCGECELCLGKTIADLPAHCFGGGPTDGGPGDGPITDAEPTDAEPTDAPPTSDGSVASDGWVLLPHCPTGVQPCLDNSWCPSGYYCITGCCKSSIQ